MASLTAYDPSLSKNASESPPKLVPFDAIQSILAHLLSTQQGVDSILSSQLHAFQLASALPPKCASLPIQTAGQVPFPPLAAGPEAQVCIKTGYAVGDSVMVSKCAAGGGDTTGNTGCVSVFDQRTLRLKAVICDEGLLTEIRTAAAAVVATRAAVLAADGCEVKKIGLIGGGVQAIWHLRLLSASKTIDPSQLTVVIKTKSEQSAQKFIQTMKDSPYEPDREYSIEMYNSTHQFHGCQVIHTVTPSRSPVLDIAEVDFPKDGKNSFLHISAIGSDSRGKAELSLDLIQQADICLTDSLAQTAERGEFQSSRCKDLTLNNLHEIGASGVLDAETGKLIIGKGVSSSNVGLFTIFDSSGMAIQDVQMAKLVDQNLQIK